MIIEEIRIKNFKSIGSVEPTEENPEGYGLILKCNPRMNAFIGKNGSGKSAVFEALEFVFKEFDSFLNIHLNMEELKIKNEKSTWINYSNNNSVYRNLEDKEREYYKKIRNRDNVYLGQPEIFVKLAYNNIVKFEYYTEFINDKEFLRAKFTFNKSVDEVKEFYTSRLLKSYTYFLHLNSDNRTEKDVKKYLSLIRESYKKEFYQRNKRIISNDDKAEEFANEKMRYFKTLSHGQKAAVLCQALIENRKSVQRSLAFLIDEPELYLHPQAKKKLYNQLKDLACKGVQIFYITHSAEFLSFEEPQFMYRFVKDKEKGTQCFYIKDYSKDKHLTEGTIKKDQNKLSYNMSFFYDIIFIVEGYHDVMFLEYVLDKKRDEITEEDYDKIAIIDACGKENLIKFYNTYTELGIKCFILFDKDAKGDGDKDNKKLKELPSYGFEENLEHYITDKDEIKRFKKFIKKTPPEKKDCVEKWINKEIDIEKQQKIDTIWNAIIKAIP